MKNRQLDTSLIHLLLAMDKDRPWRQNRRSGKGYKTPRNRAFRRAARRDPEVFTPYNRFNGWEM